HSPNGSRQAGGSSYQMPPLGAFNLVINNPVGGMRSHHGSGIQPDSAKCIAAVDGSRGDDFAVRGCAARGFASASWTRAIENPPLCKAPVQTQRARTWHVQTQKDAFLKTEAGAPRCGMVVVP